MWIAARPFSDNFLVAADVTVQVLYEWGEKCVKPEYEHLEGVIEPKPKAPATADDHPSVVLVHGRIRFSRAPVTA